MSRFARIVEDPEYEAWAEEQDEKQDIMDWLNNEIDGATVVIKPQEEFSPYVTSNS